jgi:hypothetical protein
MMMLEKGIASANHLVLYLQTARTNICKCGELHGIIVMLNSQGSDGMNHCADNNRRTIKMKPANAEVFYTGKSRGSL